MPAAFAFVETLTGVEAARSRPDMRLATDNPLLAHDPRAGGDVLDISVHLKQDEATGLVAARSIFCLSSIVCSIAMAQPNILADGPARSMSPCRCARC